MSSLEAGTRRSQTLAVIAAACVLSTSVVAGKLLGDTFLAHGARVQSAQPSLTVATPPEVVGGQPHAAAVPGQSDVIWPHAKRPAK